MHPIRRDGPATDFFEGALLGNGGLGAVVTTRPDAIVIRLGHNDVWDMRVAEGHGGDIGAFDEVLGRLEGLPGSIANIDDDPWFGDYRRAMEASYAKPYPRPFPCGSLIVGFDRRRVEVVGHEVRITDGVCRVSLLVDGAAACVELFVDQSADRLWMRYLPPDGSERSAPFDRLRLLPDPDGLYEARPNGSSDGRPKSLTRAGEVPDDPRVDVVPGLWHDRVAFRQVLPASLHRSGSLGQDDRAFRVTVRASSRLGTADHPNWYGHTQPMPRLERSIAEQPSLILCAQLDQGHVSDVPLEHGIVPNPSLADHQECAAASARTWEGYWERSGVCLEDSTIERTWYRNSYFMKCAVRPGTTCPGLFGNWSYRDIGTAWHGDYHMNYNIQQVFWGVFSSNRVEQHLPYVDLVDRLLPSARERARTYYGMRGAAFPHVAYPVPMKAFACPAPPWGWQICETPWTVQSLWWQYLYTKDLDFLRDRAMPPIRDAALFLIDYITRPGAHGQGWDDERWHIYPTVVPELYGVTPGLSLNSDCLVDLTLTRFLLGAYLEACVALGLQEAERSTMTEARDVLAHLPDYETAETPQGTVLVSVPGEDPDVVYNVPIPAMTVFPGEEHGRHSPPETYALVARSLRHQTLEGGNELVFANLQAARLGLLDLERFKRQIRYCELPNGTCTDMVLQVHGRYNDATPFDFMADMGIWVENFALTAVINECLLQSHTGTLELFPNWPSHLSAEFGQLRAVGAFLVSAKMVDGDVQWIEIVSEAGGPLTVVIPWSTGARCVWRERVESLTDRVATIPTVVGERIRLTQSPGSPSAMAD